MEYLYSHQAFIQSRKDMHISLLVIECVSVQQACSRRVCFALEPRMCTVNLVDVGTAEHRAGGQWMRALHAEGYGKPDSITRYTAWC